MNAMNQVASFGRASLAVMEFPRRRSSPRFLPLLLGLAMLVFALLQINDPVPLIWVTYYAAIACACTIAAYRLLPRVVFLALAAITATVAAVARIL